MSACINELKDRNIGLSGEEFYAVVNSYVAKINELMGKPRPDATALLKAATKKEFTGQSDEFNQALKEYLKGQDKQVAQIISSKASPEEKIEALHVIAVSEGKRRDIQISFIKVRSKNLSKEYDKLDSDKHIYAEKIEQYNQFSLLKYDPKSLQLFLEKTAGKVKDDEASMRKNILDSIEAQEAQTLAYQNKFIGRVVNFSVEDSCQILYANEENSEVG